jgi:hypothetical protein
MPHAKTRSREGSTRRVVYEALAEAQDQVAKFTSCRSTHKPLTPTLSQRERAWSLDVVRVFLEHSMRRGEPSRSGALKPPGHSTETPNRRSNRRAVHPTKKMHGQITRLERPLPPGEGWGEGLLLSKHDPVELASNSRNSVAALSSERNEVRVDLGEVDACIPDPRQHRFAHDGFLAPSPITAKEESS